MIESYTEEELRMKPEDCKLSDKTKEHLKELVDNLDKKIGEALYQDAMNIAEGKVQ